MDDGVDSVTVDLKADIDSAAVMSTAAVDLSPNAGLNAAVDSGNDTDSATLAGSKAAAISDSPIDGNAAVNRDTAIDSATNPEAPITFGRCRRFRPHCRLRYFCGLEGYGRHMEDDVKLVTVDLETVDLETAADSDAIGSDTVADSHTVIDPTPAVDSNAIADVDTAVDSGAPAV